MIFADIQIINSSERAYKSEYNNTIGKIINCTPQTVIHILHYQNPQNTPQTTDVMKYTGPVSGNFLEQLKKNHQYGSNCYYYINVEQSVILCLNNHVLNNHHSDQTNLFPFINR